MKVIKRFSSVIDLVNAWIGRIASFAVLAILAVIVIEVILRRLFHSPQIWTMDVICMTFGCYIIMVCAYGFQKKLLSQPMYRLHDSNRYHSTFCT